MKKFDNETFLQWFKTLNFIPFYNPQTFQLDSRKRPAAAIENLESFDYVVPYEEIDIFLKNVLPDISISRGKEEKLFFSLGTQRENALTGEFIGKDKVLYERAVELWELVKKNNFKPLASLTNRKKPVEKTPLSQKSKEMQKYRGIAGKITPNSIGGWAFHIDKQESIELAIYSNDHFLCIAKADKMREDLKKQKVHPTGKCGFEVVFDQPIFNKGDKVEIKILPDEILLRLGENVQNFLGL